MEITFDTSAIKPMYDWLLNYKKNGVRDEEELRKILALPEYEVEFERYNLDNLPVCKITKEDAVDFFMNFDKKEFENKRLAYKKASFLDFYNHLEERSGIVGTFLNFSDSEKNEVTSLLTNALPNKVLKDLKFKVLFIISIGNSMGWPFKDYIDFDLANLALIKDKEEFLHLLAHEILHTQFGSTIKEDITKGDELFVLNFAFEGIAVHYCNNAKTLHKPSKYSGPIYAIDQKTWDMFDYDFEELFMGFKDNYYKTKLMTIDEVSDLISKKYEQFTYKGKAIKHYPTYYLGCFFFGSIDFALGKEEVYKVLEHPEVFVEVYNKAARLLKNDSYLL